MKIIGRFFSDREKEKGWKSYQSPFKSVIIGTGGVVGGKLLLKNSAKGFVKNLKKEIEDRDLVFKIIQEARKTNPKLKAKACGFGDYVKYCYEDFIQNHKLDSKQLAEIKEIKDELLELPDSPCYVNKINVKGKLSREFVNEFANTLYTDYLNYPSVVAHEAGHGHYFNGGGKGIGKLAHSGDIVPIVSTKLAPFAGIASGILSGRDAALKESKGEKQSRLARHASWAVPTIMLSPLLIKELAASKQGIEFLKSVGADKNIQDAAKKSLRSAFGTYAGAALKDIALSEISRGVSHAGFKYFLNRKNNKDKEK